jgi:hypothetical protein
LSGARVGPGCCIVNFAFAAVRGNCRADDPDCQSKGGSGKSTLATNIAGWLAGKRQRVALGDSDPQRSASDWLARRPALFPPIAGFTGEPRKKD